MPILAITQDYGAIPRDLIDFKITVTDKSVESYKVVEVGDFIISLRSFQGGIEYSEYKGICSPAYIILRPSISIDRLFFKYYLKTPKYITHLNKKLEGIRDGKMISYTYFSEIILPLPSIEEQNKVSKFLSLIENRIQTQKKIIEQLETLMRANREKLFAQKLKFKDQNGNEFPKWEIKEFNSVLESVPTKKFQIKSSEICEKGKYKVVDQGQYYVAGYSNNEINLFKDFPVIIFGDHTTILKYINFEFIVGADGTKILKARNNDSLNYLFHNLTFRNIESEGYKRHFSILSNTYLDIPCLNEQVKIANFLSSFQEKIETEKQILEKLKLQKKFLFTNLFV